MDGQPSLGMGFLPSLEGLLTQNLRAQSPCRVYRPTLASEQPVAGLFSQGCQILLLSWTGKVARALEQLLSLGRPGPELRYSNSFLPGRRQAYPPAFTEAMEILPTSFRALITLSRQSLYLYEFILKNPQTIHHGDCSYCLGLILSYPPSP